MQHVLEVTRTNRRLMQKMLDHYSLDQLNKVPEGFSNNLIWNIAHVIVTQQLLVYGLSGLPLLVDEDMVKNYRKGTKAEGDVDQQEVDRVENLLLSIIDQTENDLNNKVFTTFKEYETSTGYVIKSLEDAMNFNNFHEGIHLGYILALKKSL